MDEETEEISKPKTGATKAEDARIEKTKETLDRADELIKRKKEENDRREKLLEREEALAERKAIGGQAEAGQEPPKEKKLSDKEYAEALERGEVNPMKEDGIS